MLSLVFEVFLEANSIFPELSVVLLTTNPGKLPPSFLVLKNVA